MLTIFRIWWPLLAGVLAVQLGNGLLSTALGLRSDAAGFTAGEIALVMSGLYAGQVLASIAAPRFIARIGHVPAYVAFALLAVASPLAVLLSTDPITWSASRFVFGFGLAGIFVVVESWLNDRSVNAMRGRVFAVYILVQLTGLMVAQAFVPMLADNLTLSMGLVAGFGLLAILPVVLGGGGTSNAASIRARLVSGAHCCVAGGRCRRDGVWVCMGGSDVDVANLRPARWV